MDGTILLAGATGTIGRATAQALGDAGYRVICPVRRAVDLPPGCEAVPTEITQPESLDALPAFDAVVSCLASRTGAPADAWRVDYEAQKALLELAQRKGAGAFVLLSAICVQKPLLAFQEAKLAFEAELQASGLAYSIVRPTAFFKSLSGQLGRLKQGKPFLLFGDGRLTACKPISDADLADYLVRCLSDPDLQNRTLPIGGPGPALTPLDQGAALFEALGQAPKYRHVSVRVMDTIIAGLRFGGRFSKALGEKAELAKIGRYYATESMLVWDAARGRYDADATPETGRDTLPEFYAKLVAGEVTVDLGDHAVF